MKTSFTNQLQGLISSLTFGPVVGIIAVIYACIEVLVVFFMELWRPDSEIDCARPFNHLRWSVNVRGQKHFNHQYKIASSAEFPEFLPIEAENLSSDRFKGQIPPVLKYNKCTVRFKTPMPSQPLD